MLEKGSGAHAALEIYVRNHRHIVGVNQHMLLLQPLQKGHRARLTSVQSGLCAIRPRYVID